MIRSKAYIIIVMLFLANNFFVAAQKQHEINILFIGNSFTFRHDLPELVKTVFEDGHPDLKVNVEKIIYGGQYLFRHHDLYFSESMVRLNSITVPEIETFKNRIQSFLDNKEAPDFYTAYWQKTGLKTVPWEKCTESLEWALKKQGWLIERVKKNDRVKWDYVVLQSWLDVMDNPDAGYTEYARKWAKIAKKEGARVILYITAPYAQNATPVDAPLNPKQTKMEMRVIRGLVKQIKPYTFVPVALGIEAIQRDGTDLTFRYVNDFHPNQRTAFLTANMFYAAFFNESPEGLAFNTVTENKTHSTEDEPNVMLDSDGGSVTVVFRGEEKKYLQKKAYNAVMKFVEWGKD